MIAYDLSGNVVGKFSGCPEAAEYYKKSLESNPNNAMTYSDLGMLYYDQKKYTEAINNFFTLVLK